MKGRLLFKRLGRAILPRDVRNFVRSPVATLKWQCLALAYRAGWTPTIKIREGWEFLCHPVALNFGYRTQMEKTDEVAEFDRFVAEAAPGMVLLDVGAHFGIFSIAALHYGGPTAKAIAVEPSPMAACVMAQQAALLKADDRLRVFKGCCAAANGNQEFVSTAFSASRQFVRARDQGKGDRSSARAITIDSLVEEFQFKPSHIKIDVEGAEHDVLLGAPHTLSGWPGPIIFLELHNSLLRQAGIDPSDTVGLLTSKGYTMDATSAGEGVFSQAVSRIILKKVLPPQ
jgi:FkbM family methyltransferase